MVAIAVSFSHEGGGVRSRYSSKEAMTAQFRLTKPAIQDRLANCRLLFTDVDD